MDSGVVQGAERAAEAAVRLAVQGRRIEAIDAYRRALAGQPAQFAWRCNLASLLAEAGRHDEAISETSAVLAQDPCFATALYSQATSLLAIGRADEAVDALRRCAEQTPVDKRVHNNLGLALAALGRYEAALEAYDRALLLDPDYWRALNNRAAARMALRQFELALADLGRALQLAPGYGRALIIRGTSLRALGHHEAALQSYRAAFPDPDALASATDVLMSELRRSGEALACAAELYRVAPERDNAAGAYHAVCQATAQWSDYDARVAFITARIRNGHWAATPFRFLTVSDAPGEQLACARLVPRRAAATGPLWRGEIYRHQRIRIAYLSADFWAHATSYLAAGLFERHDRGRFECFALAYGRAPAGDPLRPRLQSALEHFVDVDTLSDSELAAYIRDREIDILVDLKGYTSDTRLDVLHYRPAPLQVHYLGYPGTLGTPCVDYLVADRHVIPPEDERFYSEAIVRLPHTYQVTDDRRVIDESAAWGRARAQLPARGPVLCAFHQTYKLTPPVFDVWMNVLRTLPEATLWLLDSTADARRHLEGEAATRGIEPQRLVFAPSLPQAQHLARLRLADLLLDTWPYSAHTTASDALWAGVPVVALRGRSFAARVSSSVLSAAGFPELIAASLESYESLIMALCSEPTRLQALRARVSSGVRNSPLFDTAGFTRALEQGYLQMWSRYQQGLTPAAIDISAPRAQA